jgi:hypothetical protein
MRKLAAFATLFTVFWVSTALAQTATAPDASGPNSPTAAKAPEPGGPLSPQTAAGLGKEAADGSTVMVPAVPCSTAARGTDGTTTCVGIPGPIYRNQRPGYPSDTTTGLGR